MLLREGGHAVLSILSVPERADVLGFIQQIRLKLGRAARPIFLGLRTVRYPWMNG